MAFESQLEELKNQYGVLDFKQQVLLVLGSVGLVLGLVFTGFYMVQSDIDTSNRKMKKKIVRLEKILAQKSKIEREKALVENEKSKIRKSGNVSLFSFLGEKARELNIPISDIKKAPGKQFKKETDVKSESVSLNISNISSAYSAATAA